MIKITISHQSDIILEKDLITSLCQLCLSVQTEFDISPILLNKMINEKKFLKDSQFLYQQCHSEMINNLNNFKQLFFNLLNENSQIEISTGEYEKCGHLIKSHKNGYIEYCNVHKYLHPHPDLICTKQNLDYLNGGNPPDLNQTVDHQFVTKTEIQITKERYYLAIHVIYQNFINKLHYLLKLLFYHQINQSCVIQSVKIDDQTGAQLLDQMKTDINLFKSKVIYEYIDLCDQPLSEHRQLYYYLKIYSFHDV